MNRLNRKKLIEDFEYLRQGFRDALDFTALTNIERVSYDARHRYADQCVVKLGGVSVLAEGNNRDSQPNDPGKQPATTNHTKDENNG